MRKEKDERKELFQIRSQGFFGAAMLPYSELEYSGIVEKIKKLDGKFSMQ
jgi:fructose 1,6-bisphosphate aldolase/phosphatase